VSASDICVRICLYLIFCTCKVLIFDLPFFVANALISLVFSPAFALLACSTKRSAYPNRCCVLVLTVINVKMDVTDSLSGRGVD
jgi:hypothetical protein